MELLWTALLLGLVGSLHCAVMCGPLVLAVTGAARSQNSFLASRTVYHAGRLITYAAIGVLFGAVGQTFALIGLQRWLSIIAGTTILLGLLVSTRVALKIPAARLVLKLKTTFSQLLQRRTLTSQFALGAINGLLPCGLVYIAAAGAATTLSPTFGALHMVMFGVGTTPMLLGVALLNPKLRLVTMHAPKLISFSIALMAMLLIVRGMGLAIPYLSPALNGSACH